MSFSAVFAFGMPVELQYVRTWGICVGENQQFPGFPTRSDTNQAV